MGLREVLLQAREVVSGRAFNYDHQAPEIYSYDENLIPLLEVLVPRKDSLSRVNDSVSDASFALEHQYPPNERKIQFVESRNQSLLIPDKIANWRYELKIDGVRVTLFLYSRTEHTDISDELCYADRAINGKLFSQRKLPQEIIDEFVNALAYQVALTNPRQDALHDVALAIRSTWVEPQFEAHRKEAELLSKHVGKYDGLRP